MPPHISTFHSPRLTLSNSHASYVLSPGLPDVFDAEVRAVVEQLAVIVNERYTRALITIRRNLVEVVAGEYKGIDEQHFIASPQRKTGEEIRNHVDTGFADECNVVLSELLEQ